MVKSVEAINIVRDQIQRTIKPCLVPFFKLSAPRIRTRDLQLSISPVLLLKALPFNHLDEVGATPTTKKYNLLYMENVLMVLGSLGVKTLKNNCFSFITVWYSYGVTRAISISKLSNGMIKMFEPFVEGSIPQTRPHCYPIGSTGHSIIGTFVENDISILKIEQPFTVLHSSTKLNLSFEVSIFNQHGCLSGGSIIF